MKARLIAAAALVLFAGLSAKAAEPKRLDLGGRLDREIIEPGPCLKNTESRLGQYYFAQQLGERKRRNVGWFIGPYLMTMQMDMSIFAPMTTDRDINAFSDRLYLGGPMAGIIWRDLRLGALLMTGYQVQTDLIANSRRTAMISFTGVAGFLEYSHMIERRYPRRVPWVRVGYLFGAMAGTGNVILRATGLDIPGGTWEVTDTVPFASPYVGMWFSPFDWLWLQFDFGYTMPFWVTDSSKYQNDNGDPMVDGTPLGGLQIGIKLILGENPNIYYEPPEDKPGL